MKQIKIYKYKSSHGVIITPINLEIGDPTITYRLVAEGNKILTDGKKRIHVVEVPQSDISLWQEVDKTEEEIAKDNIPEAPETEEETNYKELLDIITGADDTE